MPVKLKLHPFPNIFSVMFIMLGVKQTTQKNLEIYQTILFIKNTCQHCLTEPFLG